MFEKCSRCDETLYNDKKTAHCPKCGAGYHEYCWNFIYTCSNCGYVKGNDIHVKREFAQDGESQKANVQSGVKSNPHTTPIYTNVSENNYLNNEEIGMFANVGEKLKSWAKTHFVISIVLAVLIVIITWGFNDNYFFVGLIAGLTEIFIAWAFSLILYAFGELVTNSKERKKIQQKILDELKKKKEE